MPASSAGHQGRRHAGSRHGADAAGVGQQLPAVTVGEAIRPPALQAAGEAWRLIRRPEQEQVLRAASRGGKGSQQSLAEFDMPHAIITNEPKNAIANWTAVPGVRQTAICDNNLRFAM
jgi:hypothetical protein